MLDCSTVMDQSSELQCRPRGLDTFFPFDPYQLPQSAQYIDQIGYLRYHDCIGDEVGPSLSRLGVQPCSLRVVLTTCACCCVYQYDDDKLGVDVSTGLHAHAATASSLSSVSSSLSLSFSSSRDLMSL